jgi:hypothetical protein
MSEPKDRPAAGAPPDAEFDSELDVKSVVSFGIGLGLTMTVVLGLVGLLVGHWKTLQIARDPRPSPVAEANVPRLPPEPRLQSAPVKDMDALRAREASILTTYGWVDRQAGVGRIPIDRAIDLVLEQGLPAARPEATPAPARQRPRRAASRSGAVP